MWGFIFGAVLGSAGTLAYEAYFGAQKIKAINRAVHRVRQKNPVNYEGPTRGIAWAAMLGDEVIGAGATEKLALAAARKTYEERGDFDWDEVGTVTYSKDDTEIGYIAGVKTLVHQKGPR